MFSDSLVILILTLLGMIFEEQYFAADSDKAMLTAFATLTGNQLAAAGAVHLAVNRLAAAGAYALAANIQLIVSAELPEKSIKALMGSVSESCGKLHITSVQADVAAVPGLTETVITATAIGEAGGLFEPEKAEAVILLPLKQRTKRDVNFFSLSSSPFLKTNIPFISKRLRFCLYFNCRR